MQLPTPRNRIQWVMVPTVEVPTVHLLQRQQRMVTTPKFDISRLRRLSRGTLELYGQKGVRLVSSSLDGLVIFLSLRQN